MALTEQTIPIGVYDVTCDEPWCTARYDYDGGHEPTAESARHAAATQGWTCDVTGDWCPTHAPADVGGTHAHERVAYAERLRTGLIAACMGAVVAGRATYTFYASAPWSDHAAAAPLADISNAGGMYPHAAYADSPFDRFALVYVNRGTLNHLLRNANDDDLWGKRHTARATNAASATDTVYLINAMLRVRKLPQVAVYDEGYLSASEPRTFRLFIPNGVALMVDKTFLHTVRMMVS